MDEELVAQRAGKRPAYLQANLRGDRQPAALRMLSELCYNKLGNIDPNAADTLKLDLANLGPELATRAAEFCKVWVEHQVRESDPERECGHVRGAVAL